MDRAGGNPPKRLSSDLFQEDVEPIRKDLAAILANFAAMTPLAAGHKYLEEERGIPANRSR